MKNFGNIINEDDYFIYNLQTYFNAEDYKEDIIKMVKITKGILNIEGYECHDKQEKIILKFNINGQNEIIEVFRGEFFEDFFIIKKFNEILSKHAPNSEQLFVYLGGSVSEYSIGFITKQQEIQLVKENLVDRNEDFLFENGLIPEFVPPYLHFTDDELYKEYKSIRAIKDWEKENSWHIMHLEKEFKKRHLMIPMGKEHLRGFLLLLAVIVLIISIIYFVVKLIF